MATKLALTTALLLALIAFTSAAIITTIITTTTLDDETNPGQQQQCQRQIQGRQFQSCQRYFSQRSQYDDEEMIEMNPGQSQQYSKQQCCEQIRNVNEQCRCEAIRHAVRQSQQHGGYEQGQQVYQKAMNLPRECGFRQPQQCQIRSIFV